MASFVIGLGVIAYTDPNPLANAKLNLKSKAEPLEGIFVSHSNSTWYLYNKNLSAIDAIPDAVVDAASIEDRASGDSNDDDSVADYVWNGLQID